MIGMSLMAFRMAFKDYDWCYRKFNYSLPKNQMNK